MRYIYKFLILIGVVINFYALFLVMCPEVSPGYKNYFITKESQMSPNEILALQEIKPGVSCTSFSKNLGFYSGWSSIVGGDHSIDRDIAKILFKVADPKIFNGQMHLDLKFFGVKSINIYLNNANIFSSEDFQNEEINLYFKKNSLLKESNFLKIYVSYKLISKKNFLTLKSLTVF